MLTRIQIRAQGETAHSVEAELRAARNKIAAIFGAAATMDHQVIEGSPGRGFDGRLSFHLEADRQRQGRDPARRETTRTQPLDAEGVPLDAERGKAKVR